MQTRIASGEAYRRSLKDGRQVYYDGELIEDLGAHPRFRAAVDLTARAYDEDGADPASEPFPQTKEALRRETETTSLEAQKDMTRMITRQGIVGFETTAARIEAGYPVYAERIRAFTAACRERNLRCVLTITDAKGDRALPPSKQADPDQYLRVVERRDEGVVIRGAKLHIRGAAVAHEMLILPTKQMKPGEEAWAIACAVPVNAPGVTILNAVPGPLPEASDYFPYSWDRTCPVGFVVFEDVFVPWERVFLCGEVEHSATFAHTFGVWERIAVTSLMVNDADLFAGLGQLLAEANGLEKIPHVRDKVSELVLNATMIHAGIEAAIATAEVTEDGILAPNELYTNATKFYASMNTGRMMAILHDIGGGSIINAPMPGDLRNATTRPLVEKYMVGRAGIDGEDRTRLFHGVRDIVADAYAGHWQVAVLNGSGGPFAMRMIARKNYDMDHAKAVALEAIGLAPAG